jgi:predicted MFS family arabinose efflux permease
MVEFKSPTAQYTIVTLNYWAFTLTDGALRMLVVLFFHGLGFSPLEIAGLFLLYEFFGMVTNLLGGWLASAIGLTITMQLGLTLQIIALCMLLVDSSMLTVAYVMVAQALSGIAKDLNKMSAKTSIKTLIPNSAQNRLYRWVALLTGSKNALKGIGFFLGGWLLASVGFQGAVATMVSLLTAVLLFSLMLLDRSAGIAKQQSKFKQLFSKSAAINRLSAARFFLFGARDIWFVVALPVFLQSELGWSYVQVGSLLAAWIIGYGIMQTLAPKVTAASGKTAFEWVVAISLLPAVIAAGVYLEWNTEIILVAGLLIFGGLFAINSSIHSYLIVSFAREDGASLDVGFYYMANAAGRLTCTVLSGLIYQYYGLAACLLSSSILLFAAAVASWKLPRE